MQWRIDSNRPLYMQIIAHIRREVLSGKYPLGSRIPSVRELAVEANVNPNTIQRAMTELENQGILVSNGTLGRFVTEDESVIEAMRQQAIQETLDVCATLFHELGLTTAEAAKLLLQKEEE